MEEKRKTGPEVHLVGTENNMTYRTLLDLHSGQEMFLFCHCVTLRGKMDLWEMGCAMRLAEIVFVLVGSKAEYKALCPIVRKMPEKSIFIFEDFPGRERCLCKCKDYKALLVERGCGAVRVMKEIISILMCDNILRLDSQDILACSGWRTVVNYCRFACANDTIAHMKKESSEIKKDEAKFFSLLFVEGNFALSDLLKITKAVNGDEDSTLVGCSYKEKTGLGVLWFVCDKYEEPEEEAEWKNPFKKEPLKWFKIGFAVTAIVSLILGVKLLSQDGVVSRGNMMVGDETSGIVIRTVKNAVTDVYGREIRYCQRDVVDLYGEEYKSVEELIEKEFSTEGMDIEMKLLSLYERASYETELTCRRFDGEIISFLKKGHYQLDLVGGTAKEGYTYSVKRGVKLTVDDVLADETMGEFYQVIGQYIVEALSIHPDVVDYHVNAGKEYSDKYEKFGELSAGWLLSDEGMTFLFREGDFGPMSVGVLEVTVPYSKIGHYIKQEYQ